MKHLLILTVGICLLFASVPAVADQAADEAAIRKGMEQMNAAWNKHDIEAFSVFVNEDAESWDGAQDNAAILKDTSQSWDRQKDVQWKVTEEIGIVFVTPDAAIYKVRCESTGELDENGKPVPPSKWLGAWVFAKISGKWEGRGFFARPIEE